jgi:cytochrome c
LRSAANTAAENSETFTTAAFSRIASTPSPSLTQTADFANVARDRSGVIGRCDSLNAQIMDGPVTNLKVYVFAAFALAGTVGAASAQDAALGEKVFLKCRACHQIGEAAKNAVGPVLNGIVGRKAGTYADYSYSDANKNSGITWDEATLKEYLKNPRAKVPGTKMIFPGLPKDEDIDNVIAYLKQFGADGKKS